MISLIRNRLFFNRPPRGEWNRILDREAEALPTAELPRHFHAKETAVLSLPGERFTAWLQKSGLRKLKRRNYAHKKALEFFFSFHLLEIKERERVLDAAGGDLTYLKALKKTAPRHEQVLADHIYTGTFVRRNGTKILGGDISSLRLPDRSIDKITCHHAFEHFHGNRDMAFVNEIGRLLTPGGRACIIPIFLARRYLECWNRPAMNPFDPHASLLIDDSSSLPGADAEGHFARIYNPSSFRKRVLQRATASGLRASLVTVQIDGVDIPDMDNNFGARINNPMRALVLERALP